MSSVVVTPGNVEIVFGPMFSSKTSFLKKEYMRLRAVGIPALIINYTNNNRYTGSAAALSTHDGEVVDGCSFHISLTEFEAENKELFDSARVIIIEEVQFFKDAYDFVKKHVDLGKSFIVAGLSGDYKMEPFDQISKLISIADNIVHLKAYCKICADGVTEAPFTKRITGGTEKVSVGAADQYIAVCRRHHA